ncbi:MAG: hypothetical protein II992_07020 [Lachnospiraceae bacterium]|nr:hypothetical protein [Lachnospiraceae bacterium]
MEIDGKGPIGLKIKKISTFIIHAKIKNADGGVGFMQQKKSNSKKRGWKLSVCSLIAAMVVVMAMFVAPITSKADAIHYLRPYQVTDGKVFDGEPEQSFTMAGTKYTHGVISQQGYSNMHAVFNLGEQVDSVSFTLGHLDNDRENRGTFKVYLDEVLQEEFTKALSYDMSSETVTINTTGKKHLKVLIEGDHARYGMGNIKMSSGHNYDAEITKIATVKDAGLITYTCKDCGHFYQEEIPARIHCIDYLSPYQTSSMEEYKEELGSTTYMMCMGERVYRCLKTTAGYSNANALYSLNGNYNSVTFRIGHADNDRTDGGTLNIYMDGTQVKQHALSSDMLSKEITIDTSNVTQLKLEIAGDHARYVIYDFVATPKVPAVKQHSFKEETLTEAMFGVEGVIRHTCTVCGAFYTTNTEPGTRNMTDPGIQVTLSQTNYVYNGKDRKPTVRVTYDGTELIKGAEYAVSYSKNKGAGTAKVIVKGLGFYKGQTFVTFTIQPKKTNISSMKNNKKGKAVIKWKKNFQADGYEITYSTSSYFYYPYTKNVSKKTSVTLSKLQKGYTYYVRIRPYKKSNGTKIYGEYSNVKSIYIKK